MLEESMLADWMCSSTRSLSVNSSWKARIRISKPFRALAVPAYPKTKGSRSDGSPGEKASGSIPRGTTVTGDSQPDANKLSLQNPEGTQTWFAALVVLTHSWGHLSASNIVKSIRYGEGIRSSAP